MAMRRVKGQTAAKQADVLSRLVRSLLSARRGRMTEHAGSMPITCPGARGIRYTYLLGMLRASSSSCQGQAQRNQSKQRLSIIRAECSLTHLLPYRHPHD